MSRERLALRGQRVGRTLNPSTLMSDIAKVMRGFSWRNMGRERERGESDVREPRDLPLSAARADAGDLRRVRDASCGPSASVWPDEARAYMAVPQYQYH